MGQDNKNTLKKGDLSINVPSLYYLIRIKHFYNGFLLKNRNNFQKLIYLQ